MSVSTSVRMILALLLSTLPETAVAASRFGDARGLYVVAVRQGAPSALFPDQGDVHPGFVVVTVRSQGPVVLAFASPNPMGWILAGDVSKVRGVIVNGAYRHSVKFDASVKNPPALCTAVACPAGSIRTELYTSDSGNKLFPPAPAKSKISPNFVYDRAPDGSPEAAELERTLISVSGLPVLSYKSSHQASAIETGDLAPYDTGASDVTVKLRQKDVDDYLAMITPLAQRARPFDLVQKPVFAHGFVIDDNTRLPGYLLPQLIRELRAYRSWLSSGERRRAFMGSFVQDFSRLCASDPRRICDAGSPDHRGGAFLILKNPETDPYWRAHSYGFWGWHVWFLFQRAWAFCGFWLYW